MQAIADTMKEMFPQFSAKPYEPPTDDEIRARLQKSCDAMNAERGNLTGIECPECLNRGYIAFVRETDVLGENYITVATRQCKCMVQRIALARIRRSGLGEMLDKCTFDSFKTESMWQATVKQKAQDFVSKLGRFFFIGGQSGCGKTHICTAMVGELIKMGLDAYYMLWQDTAVRLKSLVMDSDAYAREMDKLKNVDVLYIDDFMKPVSGGKPTEADVRIAYEIINARYNRECITIISSERHATEIIEIDEAIGGRILEYAKGYTVNIARKQGRNYRLNGMDEI